MGSEKYYTSSENILKTLNKYGVAIIPNILTPEECKDAQNQMWDTLEYMSEKWETPINRKETNSWKEIKNLIPSHSMLLHYFSIGHSQFIWNIRQNERCVIVFSKIWNTKSEDLLVSFDGISISLPHEITGLGWEDNNSWLHTDQSFQRNHFEGVQSWVTPYDINEGDATLTFLEGSHKYHKSFALTSNIKNISDYYQL